MAWHELGGNSSRFGKVGFFKNNFSNKQPRSDRFRFGKAIELFPILSYLAIPFDAAAWDYNKLCNAEPNRARVEPNNQLWQKEKKENSSSRASSSPRCSFDENCE